VCYCKAFDDPTCVKMTVNQYSIECRPRLLTNEQ
ncbi:conserved hypothetical protein, partial [Trichinella spiralis]